MPLSRKHALCALGASLVVATGLTVSATASAEESSAPGAAKPLRFDIDLYAGGTARFGSSDAAWVSRGGGLFGLDALYLVKPWVGVGLGYERNLFAAEKRDTGGALYTELNRTMDAPFVLGRFVPWSNELLSFFVQVGVGPTIQHVNASSTTARVGSLGGVVLEPETCNASDVGLGLRAGLGLEVNVSELISLTSQLGLDHHRLSSGMLGSCAVGAGATTLLGGRIGVTFGIGRAKAPEAPADKDNDTIVDKDDACVDVPGVKDADPKKNGCPADKDGDGVLDKDDACVDEPGNKSDDPKKNGCPGPKDRDGDGVLDDVDACPDIKGKATNDPTTNGCPGDTDGDGIRDDKDACPNEKGAADADPKQNGCPKAVRVTNGEIMILQQVQFKTDSTVILQASGALLDEVAAVIKEHAEIAKLEVQGHTDASGDKRHNKELSKGRAEAVKRALVARGVDAKRLTAVGYGQDQPVADNATPEGRAQNRRVAFKILEKKDPPPPKPAPAAKPAPAKAPAKPKAR